MSNDNVKTTAVQVDERVDQDQDLAQATARAAALIAEVDANEAKIAKALRGRSA